MQSQLQALVTKRFVTENDYVQLAHFPRYLKAIGIRLDKLRADPARDQKLMAEWAQVAMPYQRALKGQKGGDPKMTEFRWLLEELRVSLFAQELRTPMPVSVKRLQKVWESMQR
jgi:ATP-dependent helicase HrpA